MKRIFTIFSILLVVAVAAPLALAQKDKDKGKDDGQTFPGGPGRSIPKPVPQPGPSPRSLPGPSSDPRNLPGKSGGFNMPNGGQTGQTGQNGLTGGQNGGQNGTGGQKTTMGDPRRFTPPPPPSPGPTGSQGKTFTPPTLGGQTLPGTSTGNDGVKSTGRNLPRGFGQPTNNNPNDPSDQRGLKKTDLTPPSRGEVFKGGNNPVSNGGAGNSENAGNSGNVDKRFRPGQINPSGKPAMTDGAIKSGGVPPNGAGAQEALIHQPLHKQLGKPSGRGFDPAPTGTSGKQFDMSKTTTTSGLKAAGPVTASPDVAGVGTPARMRRTNFAEKGDHNVGLGTAKNTEGSISYPKSRAVRPVAPIDAPVGGQVYRSSDYHYEYANHHSSSFAFGVGISDGSTALSFGYANGHGGSAFAFGAGYASPYWYSPAWYAPVYYTPCYAAPVYYAPVYYAPAIVDPWAYNSSSYAFGFSSYGGCALSSFSFAYSSSNWGVGFGYTAAPCYSVYAPVYDPYVRAVWVPGYYDVTPERAWVPGRYDESIQTPVVESVVDPLGNTYDAVTQAGSVDYVWQEGYWTVESRRIWHPGHFEYVSAF